MTQQANRDAVADVLLFDAFDVLLELGAERGFSDLVCFLAEADRIRLPDDARTTTAARQQRILDQYWYKVEGVAREAGVPDTEGLATFVRRRIPFPTVFAPVCDAVYERIKQLVGELSAPAVMRRVIPNIDDLKPELSSVLRSAIYRRHYHAFLANNRPGPELGTLNCCDEVRVLLDSIHEYILPVEAGPSSTTQQQQQPGSASSISSADKKQHSLAASRGAREALVMGSGGTAEAASASSLLGDALSDPMLVFGRLLVALRQLQRKFFNYASGSTASVAGISEALRMELATTLNMTSSVRANDVESVDSAFAAACAGRMVRLLRSLERESFQHLQLQFLEFIQSDEYFVSLAAVRAETCESFVQWQTLQNFFASRVAEEKIVCWTDPEAFGKTFVLCEEASSAADADSAINANTAAPRGLLLKGQMSSSPGSVVKMWSVEGISCKLSNPFLVSQETLRRVLSGLYGEAQGRLNQERGGEGEGDGNFCVSFFLHPDSTAAKALLLLLYPSSNRVFGQGEFLCIAVSSVNAQHIGVACSICAPPASPLLGGLRRASLWTLSADQPDCLKFDIPINQDIAATATPWRLIDIYGIDGPPHDSLLGPCDCSIAEAVRALDLRDTLQILLLLLTNRSVLLVGMSSSRLSHLQAVLPRLAFPFLLHHTHSLAEQFSTAEEVEQWVQRLLEPGGGQRWLASCLTSAYNAASHDAKLKMAAQEGAGSEAGASHKGVFVVDIDACRVMKSADPAFKGGVGSRNSGSGSGSSQFSKLSDPVMFTKLNSKSFRALHTALSSSSPTNSTCQHAFLRYFVGIFLRFLPPTILHYPRHSIVACNVKRFLSDQPRLPNTGVHGGNGPGADSETIEIEFVTELVGLSSPSFVHLLKNHSGLFVQAPSNNDETV